MGRDWTHNYKWEIEARVQSCATKALTRISDIRQMRDVPNIDNLTIGSAYRATLAVLFVDIAGFTRITRKYRELPWVVLYILNIFAEEMIRIVREWGGIFEKNTGDGVMAYFQSAPDAVGAALTMHHATHECINAVLREHQIQALHVRIGAAIGEILLGRLGTWGQNTLTAIGDAANTASKLQEKAGIDEIAISKRVFQNLPQDTRRWCKPHYLTVPSIAPSGNPLEQALALAGSPAPFLPPPIQLLDYYSVAGRINWH